MTTKATLVRVQCAAADVGKHVAAWRRVRHLTAVQVAERFNNSRGTLWLEDGDPGLEGRSGQHHVDDLPDVYSDYAPDMCGLDLIDNHRQAQRG